MGGLAFQRQPPPRRIDSFTKAGPPLPPFVFETEGRYPQLVPARASDRLTEQASAWKQDAVLSVRGRLDGLDWQGKANVVIAANSVEVVSEGGKDRDTPNESDAPHEIDDTLIGALNTPRSHP